MGIRKMESTYDVTVNNEAIDLVRTTKIDILEANNQIIIINEKTTEYYAYDIISSGMNYLLSKMWSNEHSNLCEIFRSISKNVVECQMKLSTFCQKLSRNQNIEFAALIKSMKGVYYNSKYNVICKLPTSFKEIRRLYVDGVESIIRNW